MEVRQRMKLSFTNSSFGLIALINQCSSLPKRPWRFGKIILSALPGIPVCISSPFGLRGSRAAYLSAFEMIKPRPVLPLMETQFEAQASQGQAAAARSGRAPAGQRLKSAVRP